MSSPAVRPLAPSETFGVKAVHDPSQRRGDRPAAGQRRDSEAQFQQAITDLAARRHWRWYHTHRSDGSPAGFPDLVLCRGRRLVMAEVKSSTGRLQPKQREWLDALCEIPSVEVFIWRPSDWDAITRILA